jgi:hypothetical protein
MVLSMFSFADSRGQYGFWPAAGPLTSFVLLVTEGITSAIYILDNEDFLAKWVYIPQDHGNKLGRFLV